MLVSNNRIVEVKARREGGKDGEARDLMGLVGCPVRAGKVGSMIDKLFFCCGVHSLNEN